jgi:hypothetical protein
VFFTACIRTLAGHVRDDPERLRPIVREEGLIALIAVEKTHAGARQTRRPHRTELRSSPL